MAGDVVILVEIDVKSPAGVASTLLFSDRAIAPMAPSDSLRPNAVWDDRVIEAPSIRRMLFEDISRLQPSWGVGVAVLANADRGLDAYQGHVWGEMRISRWIEGEDSATAVRLFTGLCEMPTFGSSDGTPGRIQVALFDHRAELDKPLQSVTFTGGNNGTTVLYEGLPDGLKGRSKPLAYGNLLDAHIPAPQVNAGIRAYQLHDGAIDGGEQIFDRGDAAGIPDGGNLAGSAFDTTNPTPAPRYVTDIARGLLRMNAAPVGTVAFGFKGSSSPTYVETAGPIIARLLAKAGVPAGRISSAIGALASTAVVGAWSADGADTADLVYWLAASVSAALLPDRQGVWTVLPIAPPKTTADFTVVEDEIIRGPLADSAAPPPVAEFKVGWGRIWTTYRGTELAAALANTAAAERLAQEYRWARIEDATLKARLPSTWRTVELPTALRSEADANALAASLKALFGLRPDGSPRRQWKVTVRLDDAALGRSLGDTVRLVAPSKGIDDNFLLIAEEQLRPSRDCMTWTLWG